MRLGIDLRCLAEGEQGGIAVYTRALLPRLAAHFSNSCVGFVSGARAEVLDVPFPVQQLRWPNKLINASLVLRRKPWLDTVLQAEVVFAPTPKYIGLSPRVPLILTVHDVSFLDHPEFFTRRQRFWHYWLRMRRLLERATRIIAVSEHTAVDIRRFAPNVANRIRVIHSGADHGPKDVPTPYPGLPTTYALAFAPAEPRKNIQNLILAQNIIYSRTHMPLVLVGAGHFRGPGIISLPYLQPADRWRVLGNAEVLVYPSLYEGFGLPPLEAMRLGVPVIASHTTSIPEVTQDAAIYVDPWDPQDIARGLETVVTDATVRTNLRTRGFQQAARYSWDTCARETATIISEAYANRH